MLELPEAAVIAQQINATVAGKRILNVTAAHSPHKFAWYYGDPQNYHALLAGKTIGSAAGYGGMVEIRVEDAVLVLGDGVSPRFHNENERRPQKHQLMVEFEDFSALSASVQMYGGLWCFKEGEFDNKYYQIAKEKRSPLAKEFDRDYFDSLFDENAGKLSAKAFLATEQRIPGLGNGVLQDILFNAKIHPKEKIHALGETEKENLFHSVKSTLAEMTFQGGRDTERDLFGCFGGYKTRLSKHTVDKPCEICGTTIKKEAYLGGSIYYCSGCQ